MGGWVGVGGWVVCKCHLFCLRIGSAAPPLPVLPPPAGIGLAPPPRAPPWPGPRRSARRGPPCRPTTRWAACRRPRRRPRCATRGPAIGGGEGSPSPVGTPSIAPSLSRNAALYLPKLPSAAEPWEGERTEGDFWKFGKFISILLPSGQQHLGRRFFRYPNTEFTHSKETDSHVSVDIFVHFMFTPGRLPFSWGGGEAFVAPPMVFAGQQQQ